MLADPDRADETNLPRLIGARRRDAVLPVWLPRVAADRLRSPKVRMAARNIRRANPNVRITALARDFLDDDVAAHFTDCDFLFLAADSMGARLLFNAIVHQYGIPGIQVGAKIPIAGKRGGRERVLRQPNGDTRAGVLVVQRAHQRQQVAGRGGAGSGPPGVRVCRRPGRGGAQRGDDERRCVCTCLRRFPFPPYRFEEQRRGNGVVPMELSSRGGRLRHATAGRELRGVLVDGAQPAGNG